MALWLDVTSKCHKRTCSIELAIFGVELTTLSSAQHIPNVFPFVCGNNVHIEHFFQRQQQQQQHDHVRGCQHKVSFVGATHQCDRSSKYTLPRCIRFRKRSLRASALHVHVCMCVHMRWVWQISQLRFPCSVCVCVCVIDNFSPNHVRAIFCCFLFFINTNFFGAKQSKKNVREKEKETRRLWGNEK